MFPIFVILYLMTPARHADAGIQVQGHIEMGDSIAKLFNEVVDQFQQNVPIEASNLESHRDTELDKLKLTEQFMKPKRTWVTETNFHDLLDIAKNQEKLKSVQYLAPNPNEETGDAPEPSLLDKMMRNPYPTIVHLYGHHRITSETQQNEPRNFVNL